MKLFPVWEVAYIVACFSPFMSKVMSVFPSPPVLKFSCFPASVVWIFTFGTTFPCLSIMVTWKVVSPFCSGFIILRGSSSIAVRVGIHISEVRATVSILLTIISKAAKGRNIRYLVLPISFVLFLFIILMRFFRGKTLKLL